MVRWVRMALGLAVVAVTAAGRDDDKPVKLEMNWQKGKRFVQRFDLKTVQKLTLPGMPQPVVRVMEQSQDTALSVVKTYPGGGRDVEMEVLALRSGVRVGNVVQKFDSGAQDNSGPLAAMLQPLIGRVLTFRFDGEGQVTKVEGTEALAASGPAAQAFNEDFFKHMVTAGMTYGLPSEKVAPGSTWSHTMETPMAGLGAMTVTMHYRFEKWETLGKYDCAALVFTGKVGMKEATDDAAFQGMKVDSTVGTMTGRTWFAPKLGVPVKQELTQDLTMGMVRPDGKRITSEMRQATVAELVKVGRARR